MDRTDAGGYGNEVLYRMCEEEPRHTDPDVISGKIWLIGRAYAAAIERGSGKSADEARDQGVDLHDIIASKIAESNLDEWLELSSINRVDASSVAAVLSVHKRFVDLLASLIDKEGARARERRSFASKYLHFHRPTAFFIFDSRSQGRITKLVARKERQLPPSCTSFDKQYADFVLRCIEYRDELEKAGEGPVTPRYLDMKLLRYGVFRPTQVDKRGPK